MAEAVIAQAGNQVAIYDVVFDYRKQEIRSDGVYLHQIFQEPSSALIQKLFKAMGSKVDAIHFKVTKLEQEDEDVNGLPHYVVYIQKNGKTDARQIENLTNVMRRYSSTDSDTE